MNVLLINLARMGDLVQTTPVALGLKAEHNARVSVLVPAKYEQFARRLTGVDEVYALDEEAIAISNPGEVTIVSAFEKWSGWLTPLRKQQFDLVVNLTHDVLSTAIASLMAAKEVRGRHGVQGSVQVRGDWLRYFYAVLAHREFNGFNLCDIYRRGSGLLGGSRRVSMSPAQADRSAVEGYFDGLKEPRVLLHPGANHPNRRWPVAKYGELAVRLTDAGYSVVILAGPGETQLAKAVCAASGGVAKPLPASIPTEYLPALMEQVDLVVTNDTGPLHIAAAVETPTISVFLAMARPEDTAPYAAGHLVFETAESCHPCPEQHPCASPVCGESVPVDAVYSAAISTLKKSRIDVQTIKNSGGRFRLLKTGWDENGDLKLDELCATGRVESAEKASSFKPLWRSIFAGNSVDRDLLKVIDGFTRQEKEIMSRVATGASYILRRLNGEALFDENGQQLSVTALEKMMLEEENQAGGAQAILIPFRLERETLYARGIDVLKREAKQRFERWISLCHSFDVKVEREEALL